MARMHSFWLVAELLVIYVGLPLGYRFSPWRIPALPLLWIVSAYAWWMLRQDAGFDAGKLWNPAPVTAALPWILVPFVIGAVVLWAGVHWLAPRMEWSFVREHPAFWAMVMALYPALSVYPQGLLYRAFFMQRYAGLFSNRWAMIVASAAAFAFLHIIFRNSLAVWLTFVGGLVFAWRYAETGSLLTSSLEHALYGCWLFTVGLGEFFYHGVWPRPR